MKPTKAVLFLRSFFLYQALRFVLINLRMIKMIWMSHRGARATAEIGVTVLSPASRDVRKSGA